MLCSESSLKTDKLYKLMNIAIVKISDNDCLSKLTNEYQQYDIEIVLKAAHDLLFRHNHNQLIRNIIRDGNGEYYVYYLCRTCQNFNTPDAEPIWCFSPILFSCIYLFF